MKLSELRTGEKGVIVKVLGHGGFRKRIVEMGFIKGKVVEVLLNAPLQDPVKYKIMGYEVSLRHKEADMIEIVSTEEAKALEKEYARTCRTYRGSRLRDMHTYNPSTNMSQMPPYAWGYTDNLGSDTERSHTYLKIDNAVTATGEPANLEAIHFVRIQTGQTGSTPNLGEISTEVYGIYRPSPSLR